MNLNKFKELTQKVTFLKNYASLLVPLIIVVVSIILFVCCKIIVIDGTISCYKDIKKDGCCGTCCPCLVQNIPIVENLQNNEN